MGGIDDDDDDDDDDVMEWVVLMMMMMMMMVMITMSIRFAGLGEGGVRTDVNGCLTFIKVLALMFLRKQLNELQTFPDVSSNQDCGLFTALRS